MREKATSRKKTAVANREKGYGSLEFATAVVDICYLLASVAGFAIERSRVPLSPDHYCAVEYGPRNTSSCTSSKLRSLLWYWLVTTRS